MADYNVNMKQWNGSSFDNVLPLAFNSKALEGKSYDDIIQYAQSLDLKIASGSYVGTGTHNSNNPIELTFDFFPMLFFVPSISGSSSVQNTIKCDAIRYSTFDSFGAIAYSKSEDFYVKRNGKSILFYKGSYDPDVSGSTFYYTAIGNLVDQRTEWTITSSGTWTVPRTGRYMLELYGGGGGTNTKRGTAGYTGASSCQHYDSVDLIAGTVISITIGDSVTGEKTGGTTTFGSYSVAGGGWSGDSTIGKGAGNYGQDAISQSYSVLTYRANKGYYSEVYGAGEPKYSYYSKPGAVYLKYLGA